MKFKQYIIQTNVDGSYDIVLSTTTTKVVGNMHYQEAAEELVKQLNSITQPKTKSNGRTS